MKRKRSGQVDIIAAMFLIIFLIVMVTYFLQLSVLRTTKAAVEDALAASNLASAVIDIQEYGISHGLVIKDPEAAFSLYQEALKINLKLDENWESGNKAIISGRVEVVSYIIYNVRGADVEIFRFDSEGSCGSELIEGGFGIVTAPTGAVVESTSVYSRIRFPVRGALELEVTADKEKLVDIMKG